MEILSYTDAVGWGSDDEAVIPNDNQMFSFTDVNCTAPEDVVLRCVDWKTKSHNILLAILQGRGKGDCRTTFYIIIVLKLICFKAFIYQLERSCSNNLFRFAKDFGQIYSYPSPQLIFPYYNSLTMAY